MQEGGKGSVVIIRRLNTAPAMDSKSTQYHCQGRLRSNKDISRFKRCCRFRSPFNQIKIISAVNLYLCHFLSFRSPFAEMEIDYGSQPLPVLRWAREWYSEPAGLHPVRGHAEETARGGEEAD